MASEGKLGVGTYYFTEQLFAPWCVDTSIAWEVQSENTAAFIEFLSGCCKMVGLEANDIAYSKKHIVTDSALH